MPYFISSVLNYPAGIILSLPHACEGKVSSITLATFFNGHGIFLNKYSQKARPRASISKKQEIKQTLMELTKLQKRHLQSDSLLINLLIYTSCMFWYYHHGSSLTPLFKPGLLVTFHSALNYN